MQSTVTFPAFDGPASVQRSHFGDTRYVAARTTSSVTIPINGAGTFPLPPIARNTHSLAFAVITLDNTTTDEPHALAPPQVNGSPNHATVSPHSFGGTGGSQSKGFLVTFLTWNCLETDDSITIVNPGAPTGLPTLSGLLVFAPELGANINLDSIEQSNFRSQATGQIGNGNADLPIAASSLLAGDVALLTCIVTSDKTGVDVAGIPQLDAGTGTVVWKGTTGYESSLLAYDLTGPTVPATFRWASYPTTDGSLTAWIDVYKGS